VDLDDERRRSDVDGGITRDVDAAEDEDSFELEAEDCWKAAPVVENARVAEDHRIQDDSAETAFRGSDVEMLVMLVLRASEMMLREH
jgi:hypothetical protein